MEGPYFCKEKNKWYSIHFVSFKSVLFNLKTQNPQNQVFPPKASNKYHFQLINLQF